MRFSLQYAGLIIKHVLGLNIISDILTGTKMAILLPLKMLLEFQMKVKGHLVVPRALLASVGQMKVPTSVQAGVFHNIIVCCGFCAVLSFTFR